MTPPRRLQLLSDADELEAHRIGRVSEPDRVDAAIGDTRTAILEGRVLRRGQRRHTRVLLGMRRHQRRDTKSLAAIEANGRSTAEALGAVEAAIVLSQVRLTKAVTSAGTQAGAKAAAPVAGLGVFALVLVEILKLLFGG